MMAVIHDILRSDRDPLLDKAGHGCYTKGLVYIYAAFDAANHVWWYSIYFDECVIFPLLQNATSVHRIFIQEKFSILGKQGHFDAVGMLQKLEITINPSSKVCDGIIGHPHQKQCIASRGLVYHEKMAVKNFHSQGMYM